MFSIGEMFAIVVMIGLIIYLTHVVVRSFIVPGYKRWARNKMFNVKCKIRRCNEKCYEPGSGCPLCNRLYDVVDEIKILIYEDNLSGLGELRFCVQECVDAFQCNCKQIQTLRKRREEAKYCTNSERVNRKIEILQCENGNIYMEILKFRLKVEELARMNGQQARTDDVVVEGDSQLANLSTCTEIIDKVIVEFNRQRKNDDE